MSADLLRPFADRLAVDDGLQFDPSLEILPPPGAAPSGVHPHPPPLTLAYMAWLAYKEDPWEELKKLKETGRLAGWMVLIRAEHRGASNDYHGVAFFHPKARQLVFSHRGTKPKEIGSLWTDLFGVTFNRVPPQLMSAMTFVQVVLSKMEGHFESLFITGHSLGGWLSGATTYSAQHLTVQDGTFVYSGQSTWKPHTTTFESPGASKIIQKLRNTCEPSQVKWSALEQLDMTDYVSSPNFINTANSHEGARLLRVFNPPTPGLLTKLMNMGRNLKSEHSMQSIIDSFDDQSGFPKERFEEIWDWPSSESQRKEVDASSDPKSQTLTEPSGETLTKVRLQVREGKLTERQLACFTPEEENFLKLYVALPQDLKQMPLSSIESLELILNKLSYVAPRKFQCPTPTDVLLLVPTVRRLIHHHPLYIYELMTQKNLNKYLTKYLDVKFEAIALTDGSVIHVEAPDDPVLTAKRLLHTLQQQQTIVLAHEDLAAVRNDPMLSALREEAERFVFILIQDVDESVQMYRDQIEALRKAGIKTVVVTRTLEECLGEKVTAGRVNWTDLTPDCRDELLGLKAVRFQGSSELVSLRDLLPSFPDDDAVSLTVVIGSEVLGSILRKNFVDVGRSLPCVPHYHVQRDFFLNEIDPKLLSADDFSFIVSGITEDDFQALSVSVSPSSVLHFQSQFAYFPSSHSTTLNILHREGKFYLYNCEGDADRVPENSDGLGSFRSMEDSFRFSEEHLKNIGMPAVCIVGGEPGLGKSTTLINMAKGLKQDSPMSWVIHVDLHDHTELFERHTPHKQGAFKTKESVISFMVNDLLGCEGIEEYGVRESLEMGECRLVVDSFDEIAPRYKNFVLRLLTALKEFPVCRHLVVATRNHLLSDLQKKLGGCFMTVAKFTKEQKELFIAGKCREGDQSEKVKALLRRLPASERLSDLSCNPLQLAMLTDVLASAESGDWAKLGDLYRGFVREKEAVWKAKEGWTKDPTAMIYDTLQNVASFHTSHALHSLFPGAEAPATDESVVKYALKMGIVEQRGDTIRFIHQTFAEYFVAEFLLTVLEAPTITLGHQNLLLNEIWVKEEHAMIRGFLNDLLGGHENVPMVTEDGFERRANGNGQWVLHVAAEENHVDSVRFLEAYFERNNLGDLRDELRVGDDRGNTPIHCAAQRGSFEVLIHWGAQPEVVNMRNTHGGQTPVHLSLGLSLDSEERRETCWKWLRTHAELYHWGLLNANGDTAVHVAVRARRYHMLARMTTFRDFAKSLTLPDRAGLTPVERSLPLLGLSPKDLEGLRTWLKWVVPRYDWTRAHRADAGDSDAGVHIAALCGQFTVLLQLLDQPDVVERLSERGKSGATPIELALRAEPSDDREKIALLEWLRRVGGLRPDQSLAHLSAAQGNLLALEYMVGLTPDALRLRDATGKTPVDHLVLAEVRDPEQVRARADFLQGAVAVFDWTWMHDKGRTIFHLAAMSGRFLGLLVLQRLAGDWDVLSRRDDDGMTAVDLALCTEAWLSAEEREASLAWFELVADKHDWSAVVSGGKTGVHLAAQHGHFFLLLRLRDASGARRCLTARDEEGNTPVHLAVGAAARDDLQQAALFEWLTWLRPRFDWSMRGAGNRTVLHAAAVNGRLPTLNFFREFEETHQCLGMLDDCGKRPFDVVHSPDVTETGFLEELRWVSWAHGLHSRFEPRETAPEEPTAENEILEATRSGRFTLLLDVPGISSLTTRDGTGDTLVHIALGAEVPDDTERDARVTWLDRIQGKFDWATKGRGGFTAVHSAARAGNFTALVLLLNIPEARACLTARSDDGDTPVHQAMEAKVSNAAERTARRTWFDLIRTSFDWSTRGGFGYTAVHNAALNGLFTLLVQLYDIPETRGCLAMRHDQQNTPVHLAAMAEVSDDAERSARDTWLRLVGEEYDWAMPGRDGFTAVHHAAYEANFTVLMTLFDLPGTLRCLAMRDVNGNTPVHLSTMLGTRDVTEATARGVWYRAIRDSYDWCTEGEFDYTLVHCAAARGSFSALVQLHDLPQTHGCLGMLSPDGNTPVHLAMCAEVWSEEEEAARGTWLDLIRDQYDWATKGRCGFTALHVAAHRGLFQVLLHLYDMPQTRGSLAVCDDEGRTVLQVALDRDEDSGDEGSDRLTWMDLVLQSDTTGAQGS